MTPSDAITVVIPTSPLWINPSTEIIDETYIQLRKHLLDARIFLLMDGVHPEEQYLAERYEEFKKAILEKTWHRFYPVNFHVWLHQSGMLREFLHCMHAVNTPLILWCEHDIPLKDDSINWSGIVDVLMDGKIGAIRFELTGDPPKADETKGLVILHDVPIQLSTQYVNWPQVFRLDYLKEFILKFGDAKTYLECAERDGIVKELWSKWQYGIYTPVGDIRKCYHTDARERNAPGFGKPYIEVDGKRRHVYGSYKPYGGIS